ncbi:OprD family porin [Pseudomonas sp. PB120]|uniref:OprD family porin n=1 Tax=Pseudomonas sp. PB120 TaxID=2494700 RepID=UPI0012FD5B28|nr:OprD family porin [Pseudomonas sp. PB120]MVV51676.1 OprD family porin [Pseudomonas sp. PB120]
MNRPCFAAPLLFSIGTSLANCALADFVEDSKASVELRNFYLNRDYRQDGAKQSRTDEWAQGFTGRLVSGYTEGTVGFGVDALGQMGLKLDSSPDRRGSGLLPVGDSGQPADSYSKLGLTAKARAGKSVLNLGTLQPTLPVVMYNDTRLLGSSFRGGLLNSQDIQNLTINAGRLTQASLRDSSSNEDVGYGAASSDHFDFAGVQYAVTPRLNLSYYSANLQDIYRQQFAGLTYRLPFGEGVALKTDLRYFDSRDEGRKLAGSIDNRNFNGMIGLEYKAHRLTTAWQYLSGNNDFPFLNGAEPYVANLVTYNLFTRAQEDSWQLRYDYDFAALGVPGLTFMTRYVDGRNVRTATVDAGREWERDTDLAYVVQDGPLKGVSVRWRNVTFRSGDGLTTDADENRLIVGYTLALW